MTPVTVRIVASARLRRDDPDKAITPAGRLQLPAYPRVGDEIEWADTGRNYRVVSFAWIVDVVAATPIVVLD